MSFFPSILNRFYNNEKIEKQSIQNLAVLEPMQLPDDIALIILSDLPQPDLRSCSFVNRNWNRLASDNSLWIKFKLPFNVPDDVNIKQYISQLVHEPMQFSEEIAVKILSYLPLSDLNACSLVNRNWNILASDNSLWKKYKSLYQVPDNVNIKQYIAQNFAQNIVKSMEEVKQRLQDFINKWKANKRYKFICTIPFNENGRIDVELFYGLNKPSWEPISKVCILNKKLEETTHCYSSSRDVQIVYEEEAYSYSYKVSLPIKYNDVDNMLDQLIIKRIPELKKIEKNRIEKRRKYYKLLVLSTIIVAGSYLLNKYLNDKSDK